MEEERQKRRKRREKFEDIKTRERQEIAEYSKVKGLEIDLRAWERDFDLVNRHPSDNSDFDEESGVEFIAKKIVQDSPGVSSENLFKAKPV